MIHSPLQSELGAFVQSPLGARETEAVVVGAVHEYGMADRRVNQQYYQCPGSFTDPDYTLLRPANAQIVKSAMVPPIPTDPPSIPQRITQVMQVETPTGFIFDASAYPIWDSVPPCYDPNFGSGVIQILDLGIAGGDKNLWSWSMWIFQDGSEADWPVGTYKFTLLYEPY